MSQPAGPGTGTPGVRHRPAPVGDALARLGGADLDVLDKVPVARVRDRFVQMGLVLLSTAGLAVLSMSFALTDGLDLHPVLAVAAGLLWGFIILNLDRMLILNLVTRGGFWRSLMVVLPRLLIAALLGIVISTPLVLRIFQDEIRAQIVETNVAESTAFDEGVNDTANANELERVRGLIDRHERALRGDIDAVVTPDIQARQAALTAAEETLTQRRTASDELFTRWQCEREGAGCAGATDQTGDGPLARSLEREYTAAIAETTAAERAVAEAREALDQAREGALAQGETVLAQARQEAEAALPQLRQRRDELQEAQDLALDTGTGAFQRNDGILAQIVALNDLAEGDTEATITHVSVALLFFMIELLPVIVKLMTGIGPPSLYDRVRDMDDSRLVEAARVKQRRLTATQDEDERRQAAETTKTRAIEDDMRDRERNLGLRANDHVEKEMVRILDGALARWSATVHQAMSTGGGAPPPPTVPSAVPRSSAAQGGPAAATVPMQAPVRSNFNMPNGNKL